MSLANRSRFARLVQVRTTAADRVAAELGALARTVAEIEEAASRALREWRSALEQPAPDNCSPLDLVDAHAFRLALQRDFDGHTRRARMAREQLESCRARLTAARLAVRQVELWRDRVAAEDTTQETLQEKRANDDLAARIHKST